MREAATPAPESVHQTHAGAPGCCVLTVTVVTCDNDNRPGSKLCVRAARSQVSLSVWRQDTATIITQSSSLSIQDRVTLEINFARC